MALEQLEHADDHMQECIDNCLEAAQVCEWCADACADEDGMARCIRLCRDVADIASLHARFLARNSGYHEELGELCAKLCEECAESCREMASA